MPHLVRQREDGVEGVVPVEQHVRMDAVHGRRIGAAALSGRFVDVNPAAGEPVAHPTLIVLAQWRDRLHDPVEHFLVLVSTVEFDDGNGRVERTI